MKNFYTLSILLFTLLQTGTFLQTAAQCVDGSETTPVIMDTTIRFDAGATSTKVKFPKFDPEAGMLRCVKLTVEMTGVVDTFSILNATSSSQNVSLTYMRSDEMSGLGLLTPLSNSFNKKYGPHAVASGDTYAISRDTVLRKLMTRTLTDSIEISAFYGQDSIEFDYTIDVLVAPTIPGGTSSMSIATSAFVKFKFEYCTCSKATLPLGIKNFSVSKTSASTAQLSWMGENDGYAYSYNVEVSRDGKTFTKLTTVDRKYTPNPAYASSFSMAENDYGTYYFRVRQRWQNGYVRYTVVKPVTFSNPLFETTSLYPNPSNGSIGIKFVSTRANNILVQVTNAAGQQVLTKNLQVATTDYKVLGNLPAGTYWVKITDLSSKTVAVKQLVVQ